MLLHYQNNLVDQGLYPDDGLFRHVSITLHDFNEFRTHPDNLASSSQARDIKVETPQSFLPQTAPAHQLTASEMFNKSIKRYDSLFFNFKDGKL